MTETAKLKSVQNPFQDNLANSDILPKIQKLDVQINENYISQLGTTENASSAESKESAHQERVNKRKNARGKNKNLSIHQFDEQTQRTIQNTIKEEREQ